MWLKGKMLQWLQCYIFNCLFFFYIGEQCFINLLSFFTSFTVTTLKRQISSFYTFEFSASVAQWAQQSGRLRAGVLCPWCPDLYPRPPSPALQTKLQAPWWRKMLHYLHPQAPATKMVCNINRKCDTLVEYYRHGLVPSFGNLIPLHFFCLCCF